MRFDDVLGTVRNIDLAAPAAASAAWRQIVDLVGRGRAPADDWALSTLRAMRDRVPVETRAASGRALFGAKPPAALVALLADDEIGVGAPLLRSATLDAGDWIALLPTLGPTARAILRHRRDLPPEVTRALESFGPVDFVIGSDVAEAVDEASANVIDDTPPPAPEPVALAPPQPLPDPGPFVSVGSIALGLPLVAEALRRENDNEVPEPVEGTYRIADVVARLEAFQKRQADERPAAPTASMPAAEGFRFETDAAGMLRWVDGIARGALLGLGLARPADVGGAGVDGAAAGAFRRRTRIDRAHLLVGGSGPASGRWLISGEPVFDPATGRFTGYRGSARRPLRHEGAGTAPRADSLRQLVHELRTPTNAIAGFSEMIEHQMLGPVDEAYRGQAATMRRDAGGLLAAIDDLDAAARIDAGALQLHPEAVALSGVLTRAADDGVAALAAERGVRLALVDGPAMTQADSRSLDRIVTRLLGTMVGAAEAGETIQAAAFSPSAERVGISISRPRALDSYPGETVLTIDDEDSPATLLGLGFALRLVRNLTRALGGSVEIGRQRIVLTFPVAVDGPAGTARAN